MDCLVLFLLERVNNLIFSNTHIYIFFWLAKLYVFIKDKVKYKEVMWLYVTCNFAVINGSVIWDRPSIVGSYHKDCNCFRSIDWGWSGFLSHQILKRRSFLKNDDLIIFVDFEGIFAGFSWINNPMLWVFYWFVNTSCKVGIFWGLVFKKKMCSERSKL